MAGRSLLRRPESGADRAGQHHRLWMRCRGGCGCRRSSRTATSIHDDAGDLIGTVEVRVAVLVTLHQAVKLAFADAVAGVNFLRQQIRRSLRAGLGLTRLGEQGVERADLRVEVGEVGGGKGAGGGERGDVRIAGVVDGGAVGQTIRLGHVEQVGVAEIHGGEDVILALRFRPLRHRATDDGGGAAHGLARKPFVLRNAGGRAGLFEFFGADDRDGGGEGIARAGKGGGGLPDGFGVVQNAKHGDKHLRMGLLFYVHCFVWLRFSRGRKTRVPP